MEPIAIIGMGARFPGSADVGEFWSNVRAGLDLITFFSAEELLAAGMPADVVDDPSFVRASARIPGYDEFDAGFFGMSPREATFLDPQQRAFLEVCHSAVEDAGYDPFAVPGSMGVYGGVGYPTYGFDNLRGEQSPANEGLIALLNGGDYLSTRVSYKFGYTGPSMTILTACSSSLTAVHLACSALWVGDCDLALAGGVNIDPALIYGYWFVPGGVRSRDGHCRPFDVSAGGTVFGQGAGVVMLKRLVDAVADGDEVRAVILGTAVNNDGSDKVSFAAPSVSGQVGCIRDAMASAEVSPDEIGYVEAHGTGTALGDPIEVSALAEAWQGVSGAALEPGSCLIGSVKSNIGHAVQAAGVAGLIKLAFALRHQEIPATANFTEPNPKLELDKTPFAVASQLTPWPAGRAGRRVGALSSLGAGGTNAHLLVTEAPVAQPTPAQGRPRLVVFSARSETAVTELGQRLAGHFESVADAAFEDSVTTLQRGRRQYPARRAVVAADWQEAVRALSSPQPADGAPAEAGPIAGVAGSARPAVAFAFPGQGSLFAGMGRQLYADDSVFRAAMDECLSACGDRGSLLAELWRHDAEPDQLSDTAVAQPLLFAVEYALARAWQAVAGPPDLVLGHSVGEIAAATIAGVFDLPTAARLVIERGEAMASMPGGGMAALFCSADSVIGRLPEQVSLAAVNSATETVVSGPRDALEALLAELRADGIRSRVLRTSHGFHSPAMAEAAERFEQALAAVPLRSPELAMISAATGRLLSPDQARDPHFWAAQLVTPVWYARALECLADSGTRLVLEMGPGAALTALARGAGGFDGSARTAMAVLPRHKQGGSGTERRALLRALGVAWTLGVPVDWSVVDHDWPALRTSVPGYPYQRQRHWIDHDEPAPGIGAAHQGEHAPMPTTARTDSAWPDGLAAEPAPPGGEHQEIPAEVPPFATLTWIEQPRPVVGQRRAGSPAVALLPADPELALRVIVALQQAGLRVYPVRMDGEINAEDGDFHARPGHAEDLHAVFEQLARAGISPAFLVHALSLEHWAAVTAATAADQLDQTYFSLLALAQQAARAGSGPSASVLVLTSRSVDIAGGEPVDPVKATLHGQLRTMLLEERTMRGLLVDLGPGVAEEDLVEEVRSFTDASAQAGDPVVGLRGSRRWVRLEVPLRPAQDARPPIRRKGTYLITGGTGGLGLAVARGLARTGLQPSLVLLGRTGLPAGSDLEHSLAAGDPRVRRLHDAVTELGRHGCAVRVIGCDVADFRAMRRALDVVSAHLGPIHGVLHLAGLPGDGMQLLRSPEQAAEVLRPKVAGTLLLHELLAERGPLDFFVTFSSRASLSGLIGSGDYAAANAFLDALSGTGSALPGTRQLSINWPSWAHVGMAAGAIAQAPAGPGHQLSWETTLDAVGTWALNEHKLDGVPVLPGTAHLDLVVRAFRELVQPCAAAILVQEAVFHRPLVVRESCLFRVELRKDGPGWAFRSESVRDATPTLHVSGRIEWHASPPRRVDLDGLRAAFAGADSLDVHAVGGQTFSLGPRWAALTEVLRVGQQKLVSIELAARFADDLTVHPLHPTILDCATGIARDPAEGSYLPFMYRSLLLRGNLPGAVISHVRRRAAGSDSIVADIDLITPDGAVVAEVEGFAMRPFDPAMLDKPDRAATIAPPESPVVAWPATATGVDPDEGVRLLLDLLAARTPAQVAVRPFEHGRPVPLDAARAPAAPFAPAPAAAAALAGLPVSAQAGVPAAVSASPQRVGTIDDVMATVREIWEQTLGATDFGNDENFFDLGGSSLSAIELMTRIRDRLGVELSIAILLDSPTIESLAKELVRQGGGA